MSDYNPGLILSDSYNVNHIYLCAVIYNSEMRTRLRRKLRHAGLREAFKLTE